MKKDKFSLAVAQWKRDKPLILKNQNIYLDEVHLWGWMSGYRAGYRAALRDAKKSKPRPAKKGKR